MEGLIEMAKLKIHSIFESISGEGGGFPQGTWCKFIRLQGCNLNCSWCDTKTSHKMTLGELMSVEKIVKSCEDSKYILITGGEPLLQRFGLYRLLQILVAQGKHVQVETNGSCLIAPISQSISSLVRPSIHWVMDYKCPSSGMSHKMLSVPELARQIWDILYQGQDRVYLKWVIADKTDLEFALNKIKQLNTMSGIQQLRISTATEQIALQGEIIPHLISPLDGSGEKLKGIIEQIKQNPEYSKLLNSLIFSVQLHKLFNLP